MTTPRLRVAGTGDAEQVAWLHADSWRRHYRGAFADAFLDGDVVADRRAVWSERLAAPGGTSTVLAEDGGALVGFVHVILDEDARWGSLVDNLHVAHDKQRGGVGRALMACAAGAAAEGASSRTMYLWVLEQNVRAQSFYRAIGGEYVETATVEGPGGVPGRLNGSPRKQRFVWADVSSLATGR